MLTDTHTHTHTHTQLCGFLSGILWFEAGGLTGLIIDEHQLSDKLLLMVLNEIDGSCLTPLSEVIVSVLNLLINGLSRRPVSPLRESCECRRQTCCQFTTHD